MRWVALALLMIAMAFRLQWEYDIAEFLEYEGQVCSGVITNYKGLEVDCERSGKFYP